MLPCFCHSIAKKRNVIWIQMMLLMTSPFLAAFLHQFFWYILVLHWISHLFYVYHGNQLLCIFIYHLLCFRTGSTTYWCMIHSRKHFLLIEGKLVLVMSINQKFRHCLLIVRICLYMYCWSSPMAQTAKFFIVLEMVLLLTLYFKQKKMEYSMNLKQYLFSLTQYNIFLC